MASKKQDRQATWMLIAVLTLIAILLCLKLLS